MGGLSQLASAAFGGGSSAPSVRRPAFEVRIGSGSAKDWAAALISFSVEAALAPAVDASELCASPLSDAPTAALADAAAISAGYEDDPPVAVFTGQVGAVRGSIRGGTRITVVNGGALLARLRVNQAYDQQTAGAIVSDLASQASVDTGSIEDGVTYPYYVIDDGRSAWQHIAALARKNDFVAWFTTEGKLSFGPADSGSAVRSFQYGKDILALEVVFADPAYGTVSAIGEGAAGTQGNDAWAWLLKDASQVTSQAGSGDPQRLLVDGALRSADAARQAAAGAAAAAARTATSGRMVVSGAATVTVNSTIAIAGAPQGSLNGTALVERVLHRYSKAGGFITVIGFSLGGLL
jgi:phage protein D